MVPQLGSWGLLAALQFVASSQLADAVGDDGCLLFASNLFFYARLFEPLAHALASGLSSWNEGQTKDVVRAFGQSEEGLYAGGVAVGGQETIEREEEEVDGEGFLGAAIKAGVNHVGKRFGESVGNDRDNADGTEADDFVCQRVVAAQYFEAGGGVGNDFVYLTDAARRFFHRDDVVAVAGEAKGRFCLDVYARPGRYVVENNGERR